MREIRPRMKSPARAGALLHDLLEQRGFREKLAEYRAWLVWDEVVGPQIAARARPVRIREGVLEVRVDQPVWMQQLQLMKPKILGRLAEHLGKEVIRDIYWRRGAHRQPPAPTAPAPSPKRLPLEPEDEAAIEAAVAALEDAELRERLRGILRLQRQIDKGRGE